MFFPAVIVRKGLIFNPLDSKLDRSPSDCQIFVFLSRSSGPIPRERGISLNITLPGSTYIDIRELGAGFLMLFAFRINFIQSNFVTILHFSFTFEREREREREIIIKSICPKQYSHFNTCPAVNNKQRGGK